METTARGDVPKTLHNIAFVSISESADLEFLLWDLQDAIAAYAQLSGTVLPTRSFWRRMIPAALPVPPMALCSPLKMHPMMKRWRPLSRCSTALAAQGRVPMLLSRPTSAASSEHTGSSCVCERRATFVGCHGAAALSSVPAAASRRFVTHRAWDSCGDRFRKRWTSS